MDDAMAVYRAVLNATKANNVGIFGTSTGGGMTLAKVPRAKIEHLPLPCAVAPGAPWSDITKTGDTFYVNEMLNNVLGSDDGFLRSADLLIQVLCAVYKECPAQGWATGFGPMPISTSDRPPRHDPHRTSQATPSPALSGRPACILSEPLDLNYRIIHKTGLPSLVERPSLFNQDSLLHPSPPRLCRNLVGNMGHDLGVDLASPRAWLAPAPPRRFPINKAMLLCRRVNTFDAEIRHVLPACLQAGQIDAEGRLVAHRPFPASRE